MVRPFPEILAELSHAYEDLYSSNVALEFEVAVLRGDYTDFNDAEHAHLTVFADGSADSRGAIRPHREPIASESTGKTMENHIQTQPVEHHAGAEHVCTFARLCERMERLVERMEKSGARKQKEHDPNVISVDSGSQALSVSDTGSLRSPRKNAKDQALRFSITTNTKRLTEEFAKHDSATSAYESPYDSVGSGRTGEKAKSIHDQDFSVNWNGSKGNKDSEKRSTLKSVIEATSNILRIHSRKQAFDFVSGIVTMTYISFLGMETELQSRGVTDFESKLFVVHMIYNSIFLLELLGRVQLSGRLFFIGKGWKMNLLDVFLVLGSGLDIAIRRESSVSARMLRIIRLIRIVRTIRIVRAMGEVREFQKMVFAISSSMKTLLYSVIILFFILYFFAVIFTYAAIEVRERTVEYNEDLEVYWGTFFKSIYACFLSVSTGQSWQVVVNPLSEDSVYLTLCFVAFIAITLFGVLNAISSIFVESALMSAQHYKDLIILDKENEKEMSINHIKAVFHQIDEDGSGEISCAELEYFLAHDSLRKYMEALNISADDTRMLFRLLDSDGSGIIDIDEFCHGCMKLKGEARAFDMHVMLLQVKQFMEKWSNFTLYVSEHFADMDNRVTVINDRVTRL